MDQRAITIELTVSWDDYPEVDPELVIHDTGMLEGMKDGVSWRIIDPSVQPSPAKAEQEGYKTFEEKSIKWYRENYGKEFPYKLCEWMFNELSTTPPVKEVAYDELWDEFSEHIDDDIDSLSRVAGSSVLTERQYNKLVAKLKAAPVKEAGQPDKLPVLDLSSVSEEERHKFGYQVMTIATETLMKTFYSLGLKNHMDQMSMNDSNGDEFILMFRKIKNEKLLGPRLEFAAQPAPSGLRWVKGEYERLYEQVKAGVRTVCFIDYSFRDGDKVPHRDICTAKLFPEYIEFLSRGIGYATIWKDQTIDDFIETCEGYNVEWLSDSPAPVQVDPVEVVEALKEAVACLEWMWENMRLDHGKEHLQSDAFNIPANAIEMSRNALEKYTQSLHPKP